MLKINNLSTKKGSLEIIRNATMTVGDGEIISLMGANGAGKTTLVRAISGLEQVSGGSIEFMGEDVTGFSPEKIVNAGIIQIPEGRKLFPLMSVRDNLEVGAYTARAKANREKNLEYVYSLFPELKNFAKMAAGNLSGGQQQMVAVGRGLMAEPKLLILDEPSIGLSPLMTKRVIEAVDHINRRGIGILIAEQSIHDVLEIADRAYVLEQGAIKMGGTAEEMKNNDEIRAMYLGM